MLFLKDLFITEVLKGIRLLCDPVGQKQRGITMVVG